MNKPMNVLGDLTVIKSYEEGVEISGEIVGIDKEIVRLVKVMNQFPGIETISSCCGHGEHEIRIWFIPVAIEVLPQMLYWFDACHSGWNWPVSIYTDCSADHVTWMVSSLGDVGEEAYGASEVIAEYMENYLKEEVNPDGCGLK